MDDEKKTNLLKLMRFWLFGTFIIVFAAVVLYAGLFANQNWWMAVSVTFPIWGITALLCLVWYFGYNFYLKRKK